MMTRSRFAGPSRCTESGAAREPERRSGQLSGRGRRRAAGVALGVALGLAACAQTPVAPRHPPPVDAAVETRPDGASERLARPGAALVERLRSHTALDTRQQALIDHVERLLAVGREADAQRIGEQLEAELRSAYRAYQVQAGDSLRRIAAREDVYANRRLWPLLWHANADRLEAPDRLTTGQVLRIPLHPTVAEVVEALADGG